VFVEDVARANLLAVERAAVEGPINIGTGVETDINQLHALLAKVAGRPEPARYAEAKPGEQLRSSLDAALAARLLGWSPSVRLEEGLRRTLAWFRERPRG